MTSHASSHVRSAIDISILARFALGQEYMSAPNAKCLAGARSLMNSSGLSAADGLRLSAFSSATLACATRSVCASRSVAVVRAGKLILQASRATLRFNSGLLSCPSFCGDCRCALIVSEFSSLRSSRETVSQGRLCALIQIYGGPLLVHLAYGSCQLIKILA